MEALDQEKIKETRTERLLRQLTVNQEGFYDHGLPSKVFSYSQYTAYKICGRAYEFKYVEKSPMPNYAPLVRGVSVHAGIEFALRRKMAGEAVTLDECLAVTDDRFSKEEETVLDWGPDEDGSVTSAASVRQQSLDLIRIFINEGFAKINPAGVEEGFAKKVGDVPMVGWIDLVDVQPAVDVTNMTTEMALLAPKKRVIVDFKTTAKTWSEAQVRLNPQMTLYASVKGTPHVRIDQLITTKKVKYIQKESERTPGDIEVLTEDLNETTALIKKGVFPKCAVDNWCCNPKHCSWWDKCRGKKR